MSKSLSLAIAQSIILLYLYTLLQKLKAEQHECNRMCGNMAIPYPFTILERNCKGLPGFETKCSAEHIPHLLTTSLSNIRIVNFSYDHILIVSRELYAFPCGRRISTFEVPKNGPFRISEFNKLVTVGCDVKSYFNLYPDDVTPFTGSCLSQCNNERNLSGRGLPCKEKGCCNVPLPAGYTKYNLTVELYHSKINGSCGYSGSAIVEDNSYDKIKNSQTTDFNAENYPLRIAWAIPSNGCASVKYSSSYECAKDADCEDLEFGYVCKCRNGYVGDGYHNGSGCKVLDSSVGDRRGGVQTLSMIIAVCGTLLVVLLGGGALLWILERRKTMASKKRNFARNGGNQLERLISSRRGEEGSRLFSLDEIEKATNKFSKDLALGSGGYGTVYKGFLANGTIVAIKKSNEVDSTDIDQFINEVVILSQINHRNVVKLLGCCLESSIPLLVYEYISNGTLFEHLHSEHHHLVWEDRLRIATETAEALSYLHSAASVPIVHRDVKSSNILLDDAHNPKVADFGVSRLVPMGQTHVTTVVQGTLGYLDPEYFQTVQLTEKSDVYSFGVVLVELLTGLEPVSYERLKNQSNLAIYFLSTLKSSDLIGIIDPRLNAQEGRNMESMRKVAKLAKECLSIEGEKRPNMKEVVQELLWTRNGERPHSWVDVHTAGNEEEMIGLLVDKEQVSDSKEESRLTVEASYSMASASFSIEGFKEGIHSGR